MDAGHDDRGLDVDAVGRHLDVTGSVVGAPGSDELKPDTLLELGVDLLAPAALETAIHFGNAHRVQAREVVEGANGPTSTAADEILNDRGRSWFQTSWRTPAG
ncbi:glutamate dehydrogenase/leucine dehydrogenase [Kineococcus aurantiacus]|uniref:Glutamate dehydrogenase/leucine dehydrogenase n=1 Tax=Kineococcus aurantiacus TaxID=37633 RepID=A0A7Y9J3H2_9ACTN|nr:glutamate dehydrogenase/leucine dehydrogenase [Kineococcus aurantiacus]